MENTKTKIVRYLIRMIEAPKTERRVRVPKQKGVRVWVYGELVGYTAEYARFQTEDSLGRR